MSPPLYFPEISFGQKWPLFILAIYPFIILAYLKSTSQEELRRFTNMDWKHASHNEKNKIKEQYDLSIIGRVI